MSIVLDSKKLSENLLTKSTSDRTNVYHIAYAPEIKKVYIFCWGCNIRCRGCLCLKEINCLALEENLDVVHRDPYLRPPQHPSQLLKLKEITNILDEVEIDSVLFEGQEPSIDPCLPQICQYLKDKHNCHITLNTNGVKIPDLSNIDEVVFSLKAVTLRLYEDYTQRPIDNLLDNFKEVYQTPGVKLRAESVFIPGYIGFGETDKIARFIASLDKDIPYRIDAYFESGDNPWRKPTPEEMEDIVYLAKKHLTTITCTQQTKRNLKKEDLMFEVVRLY